MQVKAPPLMPVFRSPLQAQLLALVLPQPSVEFALSELAHALQADVATASREATRLVAAGVLDERRVGRTRLLRANSRSPVYEELTSLAQKTYGVAHLARDTFQSLKGLDRIVIFGSWASRFSGVDGPAPRDLDVLLVGTASKVQATLRADELAERLCLPVGVSFVGSGEWDGDSVNLVREIKRGPHVTFDVRGTG